MELVGTFGTYLCLAGLLVWILWRYVNRDRLGFLPGPKGIPVFGNTFQIDGLKARLSFHQWAKQYGGVYRLRVPAGDMVVVSDYKHIRECLVNKGGDFAGRVVMFRGRYLELNDSVLAMEPNDRWRHIRKLSHRYMKQFGDGMSRLEEILLQNADYMLEELESNVGRPIDTLDLLKMTALRSVTVLLLGRALEKEDRLLSNLLKYEKDIMYLTELSPDLMLMDFFPWLVHMPLSISRKMREFKRFQAGCWARIKEMQAQDGGESLTSLFLEAMSDPDAKTSGKISEAEAKMSSLILILAGVTTTARALHFMLNAMAFRTDIQNKVREEIRTLMTQDGVSRISIQQRSKMPYLRATILECLRAYDPAPATGPHTPVTDTELPGIGIIPKGTFVSANIWTLHHDEEFWGDPDVLRPERFLDDDGQLVSPDHPNRKHLMPFGAGPRVCLGEVFAMTRLFLWTAAVINKFEITPGPGSDESWLNPDVHLNRSLLEPLPNTVVFSQSL